MSDEGFEKGLKLLLNQAYDRPEPDEKFRSDLLQRLRGRQMQARAARRRKVITLYTSCVSAAAAAAIVIGVVPLGALQSTPAPSKEIVSAPAPFKPTDVTVRQFERPIPAATIEVLKRENVRTPSYGQTTLVAAPGRSAPAQVAAVPAGSVSAAELIALDGQAAQAINSVEIRTESGEWSTIKANARFTLKKGMQIRTPVGAADPVTVAIRSGALLMLDGMSRVAVGEKDLQLQDGRAVVSLAHSNLGLGLNLDRQELALQPGAMAFLRVDDSEEYAQGGEPAPVLVLLKGQALPLQDDGAVRADGNVLTANKVYELYNTGTGRYPSRDLGSYETQQRFQPMINAITASNEYH